MDVEILSSDLKDLASQLRGADKAQYRRKLAAGLREPLVPARAEVRAKIATIPSKGAQGGGHAARRGYRQGKRARGVRYGTLRSRLSAAVTVKARTTGDVSVSIYMDKAKLPPDQRNLPAYMEGIKVWRHLTYGHEPWVSQRPHPYFYATLSAHRSRVQESMLRVANEIVAELAAKRTTSMGG